jgi:phosphatidylserine/phosphatidylglycerophosphate/cardiolipin synthase-like enzyme
VALRGGMAAWDIAAWLHGCVVAWLISSTSSLKYEVGMQECRKGRYLINELIKAREHGELLLVRLLADELPAARGLALARLLPDDAGDNPVDHAHQAHTVRQLACTTRVEESVEWGRG